MLHRTVTKDTSDRYVVGRGELVLGADRVREATREPVRRDF